MTNDESVQRVREKKHEVHSNGKREPALGKVRVHRLPFLQGRTAEDHVLLRRVGVAVDFHVNALPEVDENHRLFHRCPRDDLAVHPFNPLLHIEPVLRGGRLFCVCGLKVSFVC